LSTALEANYHNCRHYKKQFAQKGGGKEDQYFPILPISIPQIIHTV